MKKNNSKQCFYFCLFFSFVLKSYLFAQKINSQKTEISLQYCINKAILNNGLVKQSKLQIGLSKNTLTLSKFAQYPSINSSFSQYFTAGRNIDPFTNQYVEDKINYQNVGLNANLLLYGGGQLRTTIKMNELGVLATEKEEKAIEEQLIVNVITVYFRVLNDEEQLKLTKKQLETTKIQLYRFEAQVREGVVSRSVIADLTSQLAGDELGLAKAENTLELSKTTLIQLINDSSLNIEQLELEKEKLVLPNIEEYKASINGLIDGLAKRQSVVLAAKTRTQIAQKAIETALTSNHPTLWLYFGLGTSYSSAAPTQQFIGDGKSPRLIESKLKDYVIVNGQQQNIVRVAEVSSGAYRNFGYLNQLGFNLNNSLGLSIKIPIFNGFLSKYKVENTNIYKQIADLQLKNTQLEVKSTIDIAYKNTLSTHKMLYLSQKQFLAIENAFVFTKARFEEGIISSIEYTLAKSNLDRINANYIQAKYDYIFRTTILDFYLGKF